MSGETVDIQITVAKPAQWGRRLTITVPAARIARERQQAVQRLVRQARLPGFRKGKVPTRIMEQRFSAAIEQETLERVMGDAYREALQREGLQPISQGAIEDVSYAEGTDLTFHVDFEVRPEVELERLGGFEVRREVPDVSDAQIDEVVDRLRSEHATWSALAEPPVAGDRVTVAITPLDVETGADVSAEPRQYELVLGENQALPPIEEAIRTLQSGADAEFTVDLPEDVDDPAAGSKAHRIRIALHKAERAELPAADDDFASMLGPFGNLAGLRARIREDLEAETWRDAERGLRVQLMQRIIEANPFDVPPSMTQQYLERVLPAREGADPDRVAEMRQSMYSAAEQAIRRILIIERVAELEGLRATPAEVEQRLNALAERLGRPAAELRRELQKNGRIHELEEEITEEKVFDYLKSLSSIQ